VLIVAFAAIDCTDPQAYINGLDQVGSRPSVLVSDQLTPLLRQILDTLSPQSGIYKRGLRALRKACGIYGILPASHCVPPGLTTVNKRPFAVGGVAEVWKARNKDNQAFAVRCIRVFEVDDFKATTKVLWLC